MLAPDFPLHAMSFYQPKNATIKTNYYTDEDKKQVAIKKKKKAEWKLYIQALRETHFRKRRLLEVLDSLEGKPIISKPR